MQDLRVFDSLDRVRLCLRYQQSSNPDLSPVDDLLALPAALRVKHPELDPLAALGAPLAEPADVVDKRCRGRVGVGRERHGDEFVVVRDQMLYAVGSITDRKMRWSQSIVSLGPRSWKTAATVVEEAQKTDRKRVQSQSRAQASKGPYRSLKQLCHYQVVRVILKSTWDPWARSGSRWR